MRRALRQAVCLSVGVVVSSGALGCGVKESKESTSNAARGTAATATPTPTPTPRPDPTVRVVYDGPYSTTEDVVTLHGHVITKNARGRKPTVHVKGASITRDGRKWTAQATLHHGENSFMVSASLKGADGDRTTASVTRKLSQAEKAAAAAAQRQTFIASAQSIPYARLIKDPDSYKRTKVVVHGQILQIQQSHGSGFMLVSVTDEGYGIWDDNVWVDYDASAPVHGAEEDLVTVYGVVKGSKSYDTQAGGSTFVPRVRAVYTDG
jgi:hypothetical protein